MQIFTSTDGTLYTKIPTATLLTGRTVPTEVTPVANKPSFSKYRRTTIISGRFDRGVTYRDDIDDFFQTGILAPAAAPVLAFSGGGTINNPQIGYYTFVHKSGTTLILESGPSPASTTVTPVNSLQMDWSAIAATSPDDRVTHVRLYRADGSNSARYVTELTLGTTVYTDSSTNLALGAQLTTAGGVPPYTLYNCTYKKRMYYAGDPDYPNRVWYSEQENPESVDALNFFVTTSGEAITGLGALGDTLAIFTINTTDVLQEHATDDFTIRMASPSIGCISHWSIVNIHDRLWFASQAGIYVYDGGFKYVSHDLRTFWKTEYAANTSAYEDCFAADDIPEYCYILSIPKAASTFRWVGYYLPFEPGVGGGEPQPWWFFDTKTRIDTALGLLTYGDRRYRLYDGAEDGYLRQEDVDADSDDDDDLGLKTCEITTKHYLMDEPGGDIEEGKSLVRMWSYMESESTAWSLQVYGGDESATDGAAAWSESLAASLKTQGSSTWVAKTVHVHIPDKASGRGFSFTYSAVSAVGLTWRGLGGHYQLGPATRPIVS